MSTVDVTSFPWDNASQTNLDRNIGSDILAEDFFNLLAGDKSGIYSPMGNKGYVSSQGLNMEIDIKAVDGIIAGRIFTTHGEDKKYTVNPSSSLNRITRIVMRRDKPERKTYIYGIDGTPALTPVAPDISTSGDFIDIALADILVEANSTAILDTNITDVRLNSEISGEIPTINQVDTTELYNKYLAQLERLDEAMEETLAGGIPDKSVSYPKLADDVIANNIINEYTQSNSALTGVGKNGTVIATSNLTAQVLLVNGVSYSVKQGEKTEIELKEGVMYTFTLDEVEKTINFNPQGTGNGNTNSVVVPAGTNPDTVDVPTDTIIFILK